MIHATASLLRVVRMSLTAWACLMLAALLVMAMPGMAMSALSSAAGGSLRPMPASTVAAHADTSAVAHEALRDDDAPACDEHPDQHAKQRRHVTAQVQKAEAQRTPPSVTVSHASHVPSLVVHLSSDILAGITQAAGPLAAPLRQSPPGHAPPRAS